MNIHKIIRPKIKTSWNLEVSAPRIIKSRFYWTKMKQNHPPELLNLSFKYIFHNKTSTNDNKCHNLCFPFPTIRASLRTLVLVFMCYLFRSWSFVLVERTSAEWGSGMGPPMQATGPPMRMQRWESVC